MLMFKNYRQFAASFHHSFVIQPRTPSRYLNSGIIKRTCQGITGSAGASSGNIMLVALFDAEFLSATTSKFPTPYRETAGWKALAATETHFNATRPRNQIGRAHV